MKIGIVGYGAMGHAVREIFTSAGILDPAKGYDTGKVLDSDYLFICVPTPQKNAGLDMSIVEDVVSRIPNDPLIVVCSALQPGTADRLSKEYGKRIVVQPEYCGDGIAHPLSDLSRQGFMILGGASDDVDKVIELYQTVYNANIRIRKVTAYEAEVIKLSENRAIAFKVLQCQELYDACRSHGVDYNLVREAVYGDDPRFNLYWTFVYPDNRGANSNCIPKDVYGWRKWAKDCPLTNAVLAYNETLINER